MTHSSPQDFSGPQLVHGALGILDLPMRDAWVRDALLRRPLPLIARVLEAVCFDTEQASPDAHEVLGSVVRVLIAPAQAGLVEGLRAEATEHSLLSLGRMLRRPPPRPPLESTPEPMIPSYGTARPLSLGERKALARRPDRRKFDALLRDPHPAVIENLLQNPRLTEEDAITIAARRPGHAEVLLSLALHPRWSTRTRVRLSLVLNPYTPPDIAVAMTCLLMNQELRLVVDITTVCDLVRSVAFELLHRRPPVLDPASIEDSEDGLVQ
jgi:hypothetical protein